MGLELGRSTIPSHQRSLLTGFAFSTSGLFKEGKVGGLACVHLDTSNGVGA